MTAEEVFRDLKTEPESLADRRRDFEIKRREIVANYERELGEVDRQIGDLNSRLAALAVGDGDDDGLLDFDSLDNTDVDVEDGE